MLQCLSINLNLKSNYFIYYLFLQELMVFIFLNENFLVFQISFNIFFNFHPINQVVILFYTFFWGLIINYLNRFLKIIIYLH
jgi:hypothetical protein